MVYGRGNELHRELTVALGAWERSYELLLIDDGSTDGTFPALKQIQAGDPHVRVIALRRNFGQTAAFAAGFAYARGHMIATSDGDLQNDPRDLPMMVETLEEGHDIVCGWRRKRRDPLADPAAALEPRQLADLAHHRRAAA